MLHFIESPDDVIALQMSGKITGDDLNAVMDRVDQAMDRHETIHVFVETRGIDGIEIASLPAHIGRAMPLFGQLGRFGRVAVVADQGWIRTMTRLESAMLPNIHYRVCMPEERDEALAWARRTGGPRPGALLMKEKAVGILDQNRLMAIATNRPDGWPQATLVGYANEDILLYFIVSREGQKFANIERDDRVSLVIGRDFHDPSTIKALSIAAHASEVREPKQRDRAVRMLLDRHPGLQRLEPPDPAHSAVMRAKPEIITILDYSNGFGHADVLTVSPGGVAMTPARDDDWGFGTVLKPIG